MVSEEDHIKYLKKNKLHVASLLDKDLPISIEIPDSTNGTMSIEYSDLGALEIRIGEYFGLQIVEADYNISMKMEDIANGGIMVPTYIVQDSVSLLYSMEIEGSGLDPRHHFYFLIKTANSVYEVQDIPGLDFNEGQAKKMFEAAKSIKGLPKKDSV